MSLFLVIFAILVILFFYKRTHYPIDLVYLWVDGTDPQWKQKKEYWKKKFNITNPYSIGDIRFQENDELKYSLRSVELYMPWIHKIFIVTDNQIPKWLNIKHPKIRIIDHKDIFPTDALPTFNSMAIETRLPFIPELNEHFIYTNDDIFVNAPVTKNLLFTKFGKPILYNNRRYEAFYKMFLSSKQNKFHINQNTIGSEIHKNIYKIKTKKIFCGTHTVTSYRKSSYLKNLKILGEYITKTTYSKFRFSSDIYRGIFDIPDNLKHRNIIKDAHKGIPKNCKFKVFGIVAENIEDIKKQEPCFFCLNNISILPQEQAQQQKDYLKERYPKKSSFEK